VSTVLPIEPYVRDPSAELHPDEVFHEYDDDPPPEPQPVY